MSEPPQVTEARVRAWVQAILRTAMIRSSRRQRWVRTHEPESWEADTTSWRAQEVSDDNEQRWVDRLLLKEFLCSLNTRERVVVRGLIQGDSDIVISSALRVTPRTVRRIRVRIRDQLKRWPPLSS